MDGWDAALCPSSRRESAGYPTCLYPEARQAGETPVRGIDCGRPGATAQYGSGLVGHLRAGFSALFIWRATWMERPSSARNPFRTMNEDSIELASLNTLQHRLAGDAE